MTKSIAAIAVVFVVATLGWMILGGTIDARTTTQDRELRAKVGQLWGSPLDQSAPAATLEVPRLVETQEQDKDGRTVVKHSTVIDHFPVPLVASDIKVDLHLDQRKKGLRWYATYRAEFTARIAGLDLRQDLAPLQLDLRYVGQNYELSVPVDVATVRELPPQGDPFSRRPSLAAPSILPPPPKPPTLIRRMPGCTPDSTFSCIERNDRPCRGPDDRIAPCSWAGVPIRRASAAELPSPAWTANATIESRRKRPGACWEDRSSRAACGLSHRSGAQTHRGACHRGHRRERRRHTRCGRFVRCDAARR